MRSGASRREPDVYCLFTSGLRHDARRLGISFSRRKGYLALPQFCTRLSSPSCVERLDHGLPTCLLTEERTLAREHHPSGAGGPRSGQSSVTVTGHQCRLASWRGRTRDITSSRMKNTPIALRIAVLGCGGARVTCSKQPVWVRVADPLGALSKRCSSSPRLRRPPPMASIRSRRFH